jgi:hypothetical protein
MEPNFSQVLLHGWCFRKFRLGKIRQQPWILINAGTASIASVLLSFYDNAGSLQARRSVALPGLGGFSETASVLAPALSTFNGYAIAEIDPALNLPATLIGFETYRDTADIAALSAVAPASLSRSGYLGHLAVNGGFATRLSFVNPGSQALSVRMTAPRR